MTDDEYFWKPVQSAFCLTERNGQFFYEWPPGSRGEAEPPVTTIAWRMAHIGLGCFYARWHNYFGDGPIAWDETPFPETADGTLAFWETWWHTWRDGILAAGNDGLWVPIGEREGDIPIMQLGVGDPFVGLALHMNREVIHHGAEICLLRDLYRARSFA